MPNVTILYHYFYPDDVVSAIHFADLAKELQSRGWKVIVIPCNRGCRDETIKYHKNEIWNDIAICRIWRPNLRQSSPLGRILNAFWMLTAWSFLAFRKKKHPDIGILIIGTDPLFSVFVARVWKLVRPNTLIVQWSFDLHEIAVVEGKFKKDSIVSKLFTKAVSWAYDACDLVVDIGDCMKSKFSEYGVNTKKITLTPWALSEPQHPLKIDPAERTRVFGDAKLVLAYSGSFSRSHTHELFFDLARRLKGSDILMVFSVRGNRINILKNAVKATDKNIKFVPFASMDNLVERLGASDIHMASLRSISTGCVVPSKFFGSLAVGRPVLFAGDSHSAIAKWIEEYKVGWVLSEDTIDEIVIDLLRLSEDKSELVQMQQRCYQVYQDNFSKNHVTSMWDKHLNNLLAINESPATPKYKNRHHKLKHI